MKFNHKELSHLLHKPSLISSWCYLSVYDFATEPKVNYIDQYMRRWCSLQGNLFLTSKTEQGSLDTVLLLEEHTVNIAQSNKYGYGFVIHFHNDSKYHAYCSSKEVAQGWVSAITDCGYVALYNTWKNLQDRFDTLIAQQNRISRCFGGEIFKVPTDESKEITVSCALPHNCPTRSTYASVYIQETHTWVLRYQTEGVHHTLTPHYSKTFFFDDISDDTVLKFCINDHSIDRIIGFLVCSVGEIKNSPNSIYVAYLEDEHGNRKVGEITLEMSTNCTTSPPTTHLTLLHFIEFSPHHTLNCHRGFVFNANTSSLHVTEQLWDVGFTVAIPLAYIEFLLRRKDVIIGSFEEFTTLDPMYDPAISSMIAHHHAVVGDLLAAKAALVPYDGVPHKKSTQKKDKGWEYVPVNLQQYCIGVSNTLQEEHNYFITTVGAFAAHNIGYKAPLHSVMLSCHRNSLYTSKHDSIMGHVNELHRLWSLIEASRDVIITAIELEEVNLYDKAVDLTTKISDLTEFCRGGEVVQSMQLMGQAETLTFESGVRARHWSSPEADYVWDGDRYRPKSVRRMSDSVQRHDEEVKINLAITAFIRAIEMKDLNTSKSLLRMLASLEPLVTQSRQGLMFMLLLEENKIFNSYFASHPDIEIRMNQCFAQALTSLFSTFYTSVLHAYSCQDANFFCQIHRIGYLIQFESLLSTYGDEQAMLEDHWVAINALARCSFILTPDALGEFTLEGLSYGVIVKLGVGPDIWLFLPPEVAKQDRITISPCLVTKGVNEQQLLADRMGSNSIQGTINLEGLCRLEVYYTSYRQWATVTKTPSDQGRLEKVMSRIARQIRCSSRDVSLLGHIDEAVRLMQGGRVTSCKSAKDRTAMSVTYEMVQLLSRDHDLMTRDHDNALSAIRSHGVRPLNCKRNTGSSKYAFNALQLRILPKEFRPPPGSYGGKVT